MANSNFVVHNGLTVGPLTIDAASGNITTTGVIAVTGGGSFGGLDSAKIQQNASNVAVTANYVNVAVNGTNVASFSSTGLTVLGTTTTINSTTLDITDLNITVAKGAASAAAANGAGITVDGASATMLYTSATDTWNFNKGVIGTSLNVSGNILSAGAIHNALTVNGATTQAGTLTVTSGFINSSGNIVATGGILSSLTVNGNVTVTTAYVMPSANAASSLGTSASRWNYIYGVDGNFLSVNANYADLAEKYVADAAYAPGTVLMFGGDKEVTECAHDMCSRVAGVVSTNPAYLMNSGLEGEHTVELALTGRVPTKVRGPIQKGDLMVSAGDGHARAEANPRVGSVIGKALEDFSGDYGVIEVVVGR